MIIKNINSIYERFNNMAAEERIGAVAFCKPVKEEKNTIAIYQLRLGISERFDRDAEGIS